MVTRKVANPAPAALVLVNPKRSKSMPARKRVTRRRRRTTAVHHRANPVRRTRRASARRVVRHHRSTAVASRRRRNPLFAKRRRHVIRRRNPVSGATGKALPLIVTGLITSTVAPMVQSAVGRFLPFGQYNSAVVLGGTGWGLSWIANRFGFSKKYSEDFLVIGLVLAGTAVLAPLFRGLLQPSVPAPQQQGMNGPYYGRRNMPRGIAAVTPVPPMLMAPQVPARTMNGIATNQVPGSFGRGF